jgi:hypothetical protein
MAYALKSLVQNIFTDQDNWKIKLLKNWPDILGHLNTKVHLEKIEHDCLVLGVNDSCWMQELYMLSPLLLTTINKKLDSPRIKSLRFKKVGIRKEITKRAPKRTFDPFITKPLSRKEEEALTLIKDPELSRSLKDFLRRCQQES